MDDTLNDFVDELNKQKDFSAEVECYKEAMRSAHYLLVNMPSGKWLHPFLVNWLSISY